MIDNAQAFGCSIDLCVLLLLDDRVSWECRSATHSVAKHLSISPKGFINLSMILQQYGLKELP